LNVFFKNTGLGILRWNVVKVNSPFSALWNNLGDTASSVISHCTGSSWQKFNKCSRAIEGVCEVNAKPQEAWAVE